MPRQKDHRRRVRSRMKKTGESYTTARLQLIHKKEPRPDLAETAGISDDAVRKRTGRTWAEWVGVLDKAGAVQKSHRDIAVYVSSLGTPGWWSQMVTVGYERIRGLRQTRQRRDGAYEATKSRTFAVPLSALYRAFADPRARSQWLPVKIAVRTAHADRTMRWTWEDQTIVQLYFAAKGAAKSSVSVQHTKLRDAEEVTRMKAWWAERLGALSEQLK